MQGKCQGCDAYGATDDIMLCGSCAEGVDTADYEKLCTVENCYSVVREDDIERNAKREIYERSKICWDCRTKEDREAIKNWRKKQRKKTLNTKKL